MTCQVHEFNVREGGTIRISLTYEEGQGTGKTTPHTDTYHGRFVELTLNERVVEVDEFETADPALQGEMRITITLADRDGGTEVVGVHEALPPGVSLPTMKRGGAWHSPGSLRWWKGCPDPALLAGSYSAMIGNMMETGLRDKVVIVTGAAAGIGQATARRFAQEGARVASWDVKEGRPEPGGVFQKVDVTSSASVEAAVQEVVERWGAVHVLVNNAGILRDAQLVKYKDGELAGMMSDEQFDAVISVNLKGVFVCTRAVTPHMIRSGGGVILNASSIVGLYGNFGQTNYVASKAGVIGMTRVWARELGKYGIRVNAVTPGFIATEMMKSIPEKILTAMVSRTPLGRMGQPEDIANAYVWLASEGASFVSGAVLGVDGGVVTGT
jgi:3-oxoacyl-[acyl-carrier protein] reductase